MATPRAPALRSNKRVRKDAEDIHDWKRDVDPDVMMAKHHLYDSWKLIDPDVMMADWAASPWRGSSPSRLLPGPIDPHDDPDAHAVIRRYTLGTEGDLTTAVPRENVLDFFYPHALKLGGLKRDAKDVDSLKMRRDVFLLAFQAVQNLSSTDKWSFYQIAGIHGLPNVPYDGDKGCWDPSNPDWWGGYCQHGSPLFPTWHRPYVMLLEQSVIRQAKLLAERLSDITEAKLVQEMADKLRIPFWDWANHTSRILGFPDVFTTTEILLAYAWKSFSRRKIPNPLKSFVLPENVGTPVASSDVFNPAAKPNYVVPSEGAPFIPLGYPTVRHVSPSYTTQNDKLNLTLLRNAETTLVEGVRSVFHHEDWLSFSNHYWSPTTKADPKKPEYGHYSSLELVHDIVHDTVGGTGGQMSHPETAGFDPIFFFHHCNVDRLLALWQYCYPTSWIPDKCSQPESDGTFTSPPGNQVDSSTDLTPFRRSQVENQFVSSDDVRTVDVDCGYSYPEILRARREKWPPALMLLHMIHLYKPPQNFIHKWFLVLERILKRAFNGPYKIRVFLDMPHADATTPLTSPNYAGSVSVFARSLIGRCANCETHQFMRSSLELTTTMLRLGITTAPEMSGDDGTVQDPQHNPLAEAGAVKLVFVNSKGEEVYPSNVPGWEDGPTRTIYYQAAVRDEDIQEILQIRADVSRRFLLTSAPFGANFHLGSVPNGLLQQTHGLPANPVHKFELTS